jgi:TonB family protein
MSCPGRASSGAAHKYYCEIGEIIEKSFRETVAEAVAEDAKHESDFKGMHAEAEMRLDQEGNLKGIWLPARSENPRFNRAALEALRRVSPLPKPPSELFKDGNMVKLFWDFRLAE